MSLYVFNHDGVLNTLQGRSYAYAKGESVEIPENLQQEIYFKGGTLSIPSEPSPVGLDKVVSITPVKTPPTRAEVISATMQGLTAAEMGSKNKPTVALLQERTGFGDITADERDVIWNSLR